MRRLALLITLAAGACSAASAQQARLAVDLNTLPAPSGLSEATLYHDALYFTARNGSDTLHLWRYTTGDGIARAATSREGSFASAPRGVTVVGDRLLFFARRTFDDESVSGASGASEADYALWSFDSTTGQVTDAMPGETFAGACVLGSHEGAFVFAAPYEAASALFVHETSSGTTTRVADVDPACDDYGGELRPPLGIVEHGKVLDGTAYFFARDAAFGAEPWRYVFASGQAKRVADIRPGSASSMGANPHMVAVYEGAVFFAADDGQTGLELWRFDPTAAAASLVADIQPGWGHSQPLWAEVYDEVLYFTLGRGTDGNNDLWTYSKADGAQRAPFRIPDPTSLPLRLTVFDERLYFTARIGEHWRLHDFDADDHSLTVYADGSEGQADLRYPRSLIIYDGALHFTDGLDGGDLWRHDGTTTERVLTLDSGTLSSFPQQFAAHDGRLFFSAQGDDDGYELWSYDPSTQATVQEADLAHPPPSTRGGSYPRDLVSTGPTLYFVAGAFPSSEIYTFESGRATQIPTDPSSAQSSTPSDLTLLDGALYYRARDKNGDYELWALDSPTSTPRRASGASPYARDRSPAHLHVHDGVLYMAAYGGPDVGNELFRFDPASHSLVLAADVAAGGEFGNPQGLVSYGGHLFFTARTVAEGFGLYGYDASSNTLTRHAQAADASARGVPLQNLTAHGGRLYFSPLDREGAGELLAFDLATGETAEPIPDGFSYCGGEPLFVRRRSRAARVQPRYELHALSARRGWHHQTPVRRADAGCPVEPPHRVRWRPLPRRHWSDGRHRTVPDSRLRRRRHCPAERRRAAV